jgi:MinD-like ATPase involved in chromosome partitioning or flagellar assembly
MNNDTPQVFGADADDYPHDPGPFAGHDGEAFPPFRGWAGWDDRVEPVAPDDDHPRRPGPAHRGYPQVPGYVPDPEYARSPGYPQDPRTGDPLAARHAPDMSYAPYVSFPPGPEYAPGTGYPAGHGYAADTTEAGFAENPGYGGEFGSVRDADPAPPMEPPAPMEPLPAAAGAQPSARVTSPPDARRMPWDGAFTAFPQFTEPETSDTLTTESLLHGKRAAPGSGWRRSVYRMTGGLLRFGESAAEIRRRDLINRVRTPVAGGHHRVAVLSLKGGVGKTTTAVGLGATFGTLRGDRVIAVDANPDRGTLSDKVRLETAATIRDLLNERGQVSRYADVRAFTSQTPSRLEVLASDRDPAVSVAFGADDYCDVAQVLGHFYSICITDCGTGLLHSAMSGVLRLADQIILVSSPSVDGARSASATLDWLEAHNCGDLVRNAVVVLSAIRPKSKSTVDLGRLEHHFASRCRAVARIPYDPHLEEGAEIELDLLGGDTAEAYLALAAVVGDGLAWPRRLTSRPALP